MEDTKKSKPVAEKKALSVDRARICVFRSNYAITAQLIDDVTGKTLASSSSSAIKEKKTPIEKAFKAGEVLAEKSKSIQINKVYFDRNDYQYHGRVKSLAEGARKGGLKF